jgi:hypothetical protein
MNPAELDEFAWFWEPNPLLEFLIGTFSPIGCGEVDLRRWEDDGGTAA